VLGGGEIPFLGAIHSLPSGWPMGNGGGDRGGGEYSYNIPALGNAEKKRSG